VTIGRAEDIAQETVEAFLHGGNLNTPAFSKQLTMDLSYVGVSLSPYRRVQVPSRPNVADYPLLNSFMRQVNSSDNIGTARSIDHVDDNSGRPTNTIQHYSDIAEFIHPKDKLSQQQSSSSHFFGTNGQFHDYYQ
jgi:hypothetical protein